MDANAAGLTAESEKQLERSPRIRRTIHVNAILSAPYLITNALATIVAGYGLLANSTAVVIGAMLIAALMGPILGLALAMVDGDTGLLRKALIAEAVGVGLVLGIGFLLGRLHFDIPLTEEILARTKPNLLDLFIALAGGAAAAYATVTPRLAAGLVGVAISTALVPPLTACGICFSRGLPSLGVSAFILFATNLVAIQCAASVVLFAFGFHNITRQDKGDRGYLRRLIVDGILFVSLTVFLTIQLKSTVNESAYHRRVRTKLAADLRRVPGAYLADVRFRSVDERDIVVAVVHVPNSIDPKITRYLESRLPRKSGRRVELHVRSLLTKETTVNGYLFEIDPTAEPVDDVTSPLRPADGTSDGIDQNTDPPKANGDAGDEE